MNKNLKSIDLTSTYPNGALTFSKRCCHQASMHDSFVCSEQRNYYKQKIWYKSYLKNIKKLLSSRPSEPYGFQKLTLLPLDLLTLPLCVIQILLPFLNIQEKHLPGNRHLYILGLSGLEATLFNPSTFLIGKAFRYPNCSFRRIFIVGWGGD